MRSLIYTYWEGPCPPLIELCLQSLDRWNRGRVRVLGPEDIPRSIRNATAGISSAYRSDLVRIWALLQYGGLWVDADSICVGSVTEVDEAARVDLLGVYNPYQRDGWSADGLLASPIGGRRNSAVFAEMFDECRRALARHQAGKRVRYGWTSAGIASAVWRRHRNSPRVIRKQHWQLHRIPWYRARKLFSRVALRGQHEFQGHWNPNAKLYHLTNAVVRDNRDLTREQLLRGKTFLSYLLQKAFSLPPAIFGRTAEVLQRLPAGARRGAEIGVFRGVNARHLLQQRKDLELLLVDRWGEYPPGSYRESEDYQSQFDQARWERIFTQVLPEHLRFATGRYQLLRMWSSHAAERVTDQSLDFVFIDGDHSYHGVQQDLQAWLPKVKLGGFIGGHDYNHPREGVHYGVRRAVDELATSCGQKVEIGQDLTWFLPITPAVAFPG